MPNYQIIYEHEGAIWTTVWAGADYGKALDSFRRTNPRVKVKAAGKTQDPADTKPMPGLKAAEEAEGKE